MLNPTMKREFDTVNDRILAKGFYASNGTLGCKPNNNDLIIGPSGSGKTRGYVKPNLLQYARNGLSSLIITDTKGSLMEEVGPVLKNHGYEILKLDLMDLMNNNVGYNPLDYIDYDERTDTFSENDIATITTCLSPMQDKSEPFWDLSARAFLKAFIAYVMEGLDKHERTPEALTELYLRADDEIYDPYNRSNPLNKQLLGNVLFSALEVKKPGCAANRFYTLAKQVIKSDKTYASIKGFLSNNLEPLMTYGARRLSNLEKRIDFESIARKKTALFLTISDNDEAMYPLANLFYTQALQELMKFADSLPGAHLPIPVRIILDDFATNVIIPGFDRKISVIRSRHISVSVIIQSISQLFTIYKESEANTIINNCDNVLYLGGQDMDTIEFVSKKANKCFDTISAMPLDEAWLFVRGDKPQPAKQFDITEHDLFSETPEYSGISATMAKVFGGEVGVGMGIPVLSEFIAATLKGRDPLAGLEDDIVDDDVTAFDETEIWGGINDELDCPDDLAECTEDIFDIWSADFEECDEELPFNTDDDE